MDRSNSFHCERRLREIAEQYGAVLATDETPLYCPSQIPTFMVADDERKADAVLGQLKIEAAEPQSRGLKRAFAKSSKPTPPTYTELYAALLRVIEDNGLPGVVEVLLKRFRGLDGDISIARRTSTSMISRVRSSNAPHEKGWLIQKATETRRNDLMQLLSPHANQQSLDESLRIALGMRSNDDVVTLLQYGANSAPHEPLFTQAVENGDSELVDILLRAQKRVSAQCISLSLLPAARKGHCFVTLLLLRAGADANQNEASAFRFAVENDRPDIATALVRGKSPPSGVAINWAIEHIVNKPPHMINESYRLLEMLLCGGPTGNAKNKALITAVTIVNVDLVRLLLSHHADINYDRATALGHAIQSNRLDLVAMLLQNQNLNPDLASTLVCQIPERSHSADRVAIVSKLLVSGASGAECSQLLIVAAEQNDLDTARLLVSAKDSKGVQVCSVDFNAGRCLGIASSRSNLEMVKILALEGTPSKFSLSKALTSIPLASDIHCHFFIVQTLLQAGAEGPEVDDLLHTSVTQQRSKDFIELVTQNSASVSDETLLSAVSQGSPEIVEILLGGNVSVQSCLSTIPQAMKLQAHHVRYQIIKDLLRPIRTSGFESNLIADSLIDTLRNFPDDLQLVHLFCQDGRANINLYDGQPVTLALNIRDPKALGIVLQSEGGLPNYATLENGLQYAIDLPLTDPSRYHKVERLLRGVKPQKVMDNCLLKEIRSAIAQKHDLSVLHALLAAGADINSNNGAPVFFAVPDPTIMDIVLSKRPNAESLSIAFTQAVKLKDPPRYNLCEKLLRAGAAGEEINKALCVAASEGTSSIHLLRLLLPHADVNHRGGRALRRIVEQASLEGLDLLLSRRLVMPSAATKMGAFYEGMKLTNIQQRRAIVKRLLLADIPGEAVSDALITAANHADMELTYSLLQFGASVEHKSGQAVLCAASLGEQNILRLLVQGKYGTKPTLSTLMSGLGGAMALKDKDADSYCMVVQILLEAGARGEAVDAALVSATSEGDKNLKMIELLCKNGASVEWNDGAALDAATRSASVEAVATVLRRQPTQTVLKRAYRSANNLPKDQRYRIIELLLNAGKLIDKHVSNTLTIATQELPADCKLIELLLSRHAYDSGESMIHTASMLDLETLTLLAEAPQAKSVINSAFDHTVKTDNIWHSHKGLSIVELMLKHGVSGDIISEALCLAAEKLATAKNADLIKDFMDMLLGFGADVNYQRGLALQRVASRGRVNLIQKFLLNASTCTKAMAFPYLFSASSDIERVLEIIRVFDESLPDVDKDSFATFQHPDLELDPILFSALSAFPRKSEVLQALLDIGYNPSQWKQHEVTPGAGMEPWPILNWALEQPEKRVSNVNIEILIDSGANINFTSKSGVTPLILAIQNQRTDIVPKLISKGVKVSVPDQDGVTPLALASRFGNSTIMELILQEGPEINDGSLHDAANQLRCNTMRVLIKHGHHVDYPSDRHDGRSALAELCLNAVSHDPKPADLEQAIMCLVANDADIQLRCVSEDRSEKSILHYALDSRDPVSILTVLLKLMWKQVNHDAFLYKDERYTYSLTKYVEKEIYLGPRDQRSELLRLLRNKRALDRFWATDIEAEQPVDFCNPPPYIEEEVQRQKLRRKRMSEQREEAMAQLDLKRLATVKEVEFSDIQSKAEIRRTQEKADVDRNLITQYAGTQLQLELHAENERQRVLGYQQAREINHLKSMSEIQVSTRRQLAQEAIEEEQARQKLQISYVESRVNTENEGLRIRLAIEGSGKHEDESYDQRRHEREMARIKTQKSLVESQTTFAGSLHASGMNQRQIGYIAGEIT